MKQHYYSRTEVCIKPVKNGYIVYVSGVANGDYVCSTFEEAVNHVARALCLVVVGETVRLASEGET